jgi:hypothetical protein
MRRLLVIISFSVTGEKGIDRGEGSFRDRFPGGRGSVTGFVWGWESAESSRRPLRGRRGSVGIDGEVGLGVETGEPGSPSADESADCTLKSCATMAMLYLGLFLE